jgi:LysR family transcriptional regulator for bpeEF and oprC
MPRPVSVFNHGRGEEWAMDIVLAMRVFARVVETNSFTRAAETLDMPRGRVTVTVQALEARLKTRLLQRTTRTLNLTPDGAAYYERCRRVLADLDDIESSFLGKQRTPRGRLRVDMPGALGRLVVTPALGDFHERYPEIDLMLGLGDKPLDLVQEGIDCVVRIGTLQDSSLVARRVGIYEAVTVASPAYLQKAGTPETLAELANHRTVNYYWSRTGRIMPLAFEANGEVVEVKMRGAIAVNDAEAYLRSAVNGFGIAQGARFMALPYLQSGALIEILAPWKPPPLPISAVYPHNRHLSATVSAFIGWIAELLRDSPLFSSTPEIDARCRPTSAGGPAADPFGFEGDEAEPLA